MTTCRDTPVPARTDAALREAAEEEARRARPRDAAAAADLSELLFGPGTGERRAA